MGVQRRVWSSLGGEGQSRATISEILSRRSSRSGATTTTASEACEAQKGHGARSWHGDHDTVARLPCDASVILALETGGEINVVRAGAGEGRELSDQHASALLFTLRVDRRDEEGAVVAEQIAWSGIPRCPVDTDVLEGVVTEGRAVLMERTDGEVGVPLQIGREGEER